MLEELPYVSVPLRDAEAARKVLGDADALAPAPARRAAQRLLVPVIDADTAVDLLMGVGIFANTGIGRFVIREQDRRIPYDLIGSIAIVRDCGVKEAEEVMRRHKKVRTVYCTGGIDGPHRTPELQLLAGPDLPVTVVRESGFNMEVDVRNSYYSPRLATERERVSALMGDCESALDMFCGVGPFSLHMARGGCDVFAVDINEVAVLLARRNAEKNGFAEKITTVVGDSHQAVPALARRGLRVDRIIMNHPTGAMEFLDDALTIIERGTIHLYLMVARSNEDMIVGEMQRVLEGRSYAINRHKVRSVSPAVDQWCFDISLST
jgi:tRNA (guanine37-N1)-methyltransferase